MGFDKQEQGLTSEPRFTADNIGSFQVHAKSRYRLNDSTSFRSALFVIATIFTSENPTR